MQDTAEAMAIHQDLLDRSGAAMMARDYAAFRAVFALPTVIETFEFRCVLDSEAALRDLFDRVTHHRDVGRVADIVRRCVSAGYRDADTICATHETRYILQGNILQKEPHSGFSVLQRDAAGDWRVSSSQYAVWGGNALNRAIRA